MHSSFVRDDLSRCDVHVERNRLVSAQPDFDMVRDLMIETGVLKDKIEFEEYTDLRFADRATIQTAWKYEPGSASAQ